MVYHLPETCCSQSRETSFVWPTEMENDTVMLQYHLILLHEKDASKKM